MRDRVADHAHGDPGLVVARIHAALEQALEAVLQLRGAPEFVRGVPARRPQARRADDRPRVPGAIGQIAGENLVFVGCDEHVVIGRVLGEDRHLPLDLHAARVRAPAAAGVLVHALLDDFRAEFLRRPPVGLREQLVLRMRPDHQEPASPLLPDQILREPVGQHRTRRRDVDHIGAAILLAQTIVRRARVEHQRAGGARGVGDRENLGRREDRR